MNNSLLKTLPLLISLAVSSPAWADEQLKFLQNQFEQQLEAHEASIQRCEKALKPVSSIEVDPKTLNKANISFEELGIALLHLAHINMEKCLQPNSAELAFSALRLRAWQASLPFGEPQGRAEEPTREPSDSFFSLLLPTAKYIEFERRYLDLPDDKKKVLEDLVGNQVIRGTQIKNWDALRQQANQKP